MLVHEKGHSLPLSISTVTGFRVPTSTHLCITQAVTVTVAVVLFSPSALLNLLLHFHCTNKQRVELDGNHPLPLEPFRLPQTKLSRLCLPGNRVSEMLERELKLTSRGCNFYLPAASAG